MHITYNTLPRRLHTSTWLTVQYRTAPGTVSAQHTETAPTERNLQRSMTNFQFSNGKSSRQLHHPTAAMAADDLPGLQPISPALCGEQASADPTQRPSQNHHQTATRSLYTPQVSTLGRSTSYEILRDHSKIGFKKKLCLVPSNSVEKCVGVVGHLFQRTNKKTGPVLGPYVEQCIR